MSRHRTVHAWSIALGSGLAFLFAASAHDVVRAVSHGLLAPDTVFAAQDPAQTVDPAAGRGGGGRGQGAAAAPRPYDQVITRAAVTDDGVFKVHRITQGSSDTLYYEIPRSELGKDFLINSQIKRNAAGSGGYGGQQIGTRVVRWVLKGDRVLLQNIDYSLVADPSNPLLSEANLPAIIRAFPVAAYKGDTPAGDPVIDVTSLYLGDVAELSARGGGGGRGDASRSFLEKAVSFPMNINVEVTLTSSGSAGAAGAAAPAPGGRGGGGGGPSTTILVSHSMVKLPENADDAAPVRRARRLLHAGRHRLRDRRAAGDAEALHHALPPREEGSERRHLRAREAHRLLRGPVHAEEVGAVDQEGHRGLAAGVRSGRLQERHHRERSADQRSGLERRGRAVLGDSVPAVHDRERGRAARARPAQRRDHQRGRAVLPQRHEPREELVLRPGRPARRARAATAAARRPHGPAH